MRVGDSSYNFAKSRLGTHFRGDVPPLRPGNFTISCKNQTDVASTIRSCNREWRGHDPCLIHNVQALSMTAGLRKKHAHDTRRIFLFQTLEKPCQRSSISSTSSGKRWRLGTLRSRPRSWLMILRIRHYQRSMSHQSGFILAVKSVLILGGFQPGWELRDARKINGEGACRRDQFQAQVSQGRNLHFVWPSCTYTKTHLGDATVRDLRHHR